MTPTGLIPLRSGNHWVGFLALGDSAAIETRVGFGPLLIKRRCWKETRCNYNSSFNTWLMAILSGNLLIKFRKKEKKKKNIIGVWRYFFRNPWEPFPQKNSHFHPRRKKIQRKKKTPVGRFMVSVSLDHILLNLKPLCASLNPDPYKIKHIKRLL